MRSPFSHFWICIAACAALAACETPDDDPSPPDADVPDASIGAGGMGGEGGAGGVGGEGGVGGMGGMGGIPEGDCVDIDDEAGCEAREDCAPRRDAVAGGFVDCRPLEDVPCSMLSGADCDRRGDCEMDGELCSPLPVECADHGEARACADAGCHWWEDTCHDDPRPMPCDQPDPESCNNAGCMWAEDGCRPRPPACESLERQVACDAREDCRWNNNRCEIDPGDRECEELDAMQCAEREDCGWDGEGCGPMPEGACGELDYTECDMRPDCESNGCNCPPDAECDCENLCWPREFDCADVPIDACDRTPGCMVEEVCGGDGDEGGEGGFAPGEDPAEPEPGRPAPPACEERCVVDEADRCEQLDERACMADPDCHVEYEFDCGDFGGDADGAPDRVPCMERAVCVEGGEDRVICAEIADARVCMATDGCQIANECVCDEPMPEPADCDCREGEPCPCLVALPPCDCPICEDADGPPPGECEGRDLDACLDDPACEWVWAAEDLPGGGGACECFQDENGREICECIDIAPAPEDGWCVDGNPPPPNMCEEFINPERCEAVDGCQWVAVACGNCRVDDAGNEICPDCDGDEDMVGGFCTPGDVMPEGCEQHFDPDRCEADPNCGWVAFDCECFVGADGEEICPPCAAPGGFCEWREVDPCEGFGEAVCADVEGCEWIPDGDEPGEPVEPGDPVDPDEPMDDGRDPADPAEGEAARPAPCPCEPGPDGEMICDCDPIEPPPPPVGGRCVSAAPAGEQCWAYGPDECEADPECGLLDGAGMAMPGALIAPALVCLPVNLYCGTLSADQCDLDRCAIEEREMCWGGGACPPGEPCMDPAPGEGECIVEMVCVGR